MATLKVNNYSLVVFRFVDWETPMPLFESYEVAKLLGYSQHSSLRKQALTDWKGVLDESDWVLSHEEVVIRKYEHEHLEAGNGFLRPVSAKRGRLFFTAEGLVKVLNRSTKNTEPLRQALARGGYLDSLKGVMIVKDEAPQAFIRGVPCARCDRPLDRNADCPCTPPLPVAAPTPLVEAEPPVQVPSQDVREYEHGIYQTLMGHLANNQNGLDLRRLAIIAAEVGLGRELHEVRKLFGLIPAKKPQPKKTAPTPIPKGPVFTTDGFYSMTRIGALAGGYTSRQAGLAINLVGDRHGYSPEQLRNEQLPVNEVAMRPDSTTGKKRQMVRFAKEFANAVVLELRLNDKFRPSLARGIPTLPAFESGGDEGYPSLARGPLDS